MTEKSYPDPRMTEIPHRLLLGPGPSNVNPRVLQAMMSPMIGYLDPDFLLVMDEISSLLRTPFQTTKNTTMALSGTGSAGMEAGLNSFIESDDTVIICVCGFFGQRMVEMAKRLGANVVALYGDWGKPFPPELLETELKNHVDVKLVTVVHAETSTGILQPLEDISRLAKQHGALFMVDAVTSLGGNEVAVDRLNIDYCYSATQKCLGCPPGLAPSCLSDKAYEVIKSRRSKPKSWYLDLQLIANYWGSEHVYHHTAPVSMLLGLREGLRLVSEEGLGNAFQRHKKHATALYEGLSALGLEVATPRQFRLPQVTPVWIPKGVNDITIRSILLRKYQIEIGRGLGDFAGKVWRIGLMGHSSRAEYVLALLSALEDILPGQGLHATQGAGVGAASKSLAES